MQILAFVRESSIQQAYQARIFPFQKWMPYWTNLISSYWTLLIACRHLRWHRSLLFQDLCSNILHRFPSRQCLFSSLCFWCHKANCFAGIDLRRCIAGFCIIPNDFVIVAARKLSQRWNLEQMIWLTSYLLLSTFWGLGQSCLSNSQSLIWRQFFCNQSHSCGIGIALLDFMKIFHYMNGLS